MVRGMLQRKGRSRTSTKSLNYLGNTTDSRPAVEDAAGERSRRSKWGWIWCLIRWWGPELTKCGQNRVRPTSRMKHVGDSAMTSEP
jgi:hypothetical protein